jgi:S-adenosylmethionine:tRNA-ribosyltransferase-isomerase (queuine synthetase)
MLIFAENNCVVFECEHCGANERLESKRRNKRQFQTVLNKFMRTHDWNCRWKVERQRKIDDAIATTDSIIKQLVKECR